MLHRIGWRLTAMIGAVLYVTSSGLLRALTAVRFLRRMPRLCVVPIERMLIAIDGRDLFDAQYYLSNNPDVAQSGLSALGHYLMCGWREDRPPNPHFDDAHYRVLSGLLPAVPVSPLAHYLAIGRHAGLTPTPVAAPEILGRAAPALEVARLDSYRGLIRGQIDAPDEGRPEIETVLARLASMTAERPSDPLVDVIIPVFQGRAETLNAILHALTARNTTACEIVVVDDATPDHELAGALDDLCARNLITLIRNAENQGFPESINRGMAIHPARDVIWLNADTEVYGGWIDRLRAAAYSRPDVATVTPLTNNGTICSYPRPNTDNFGELENSWSRIDRIAADINRGLVVEAPTGVGFAMYVRRAALDTLGDLNVPAFGRGYGEENDFCQRAIQKGWVNLLAADVFVRHFGATSFQGKRAERIATAMRTMDNLHPKYRGDVETFISADPLSQARRRLDVARLTANTGPRSILLVTHSRGGGTAQHVQEETDRLLAEGWTVFVLTGSPHGCGRARLMRAGVAALPSLEALDFEDPDLWLVLATLKLSRVDIHHLIDFPSKASVVLAERLAGIGVGYDVVIHDYFSICPRINLVDHTGRYCGEPDDPGCDRCLTRRGSVVGRVKIGPWRARYRTLLEGAGQIRVPDDDVARRLGRYFPDLTIRTVPHDNVSANLPASRNGPGNGLHVAVIGAIGAIKGFDAVLGLSRYAVSRDPSVRVTVIGYTHNDVIARAAGIDVMGAYTNDEVQGLIEKVQPDIIWIPSLWPETFCYTLSIAMTSGRPIAVFDLGAQANRVRCAGFGHIIPVSDWDKPATLLNHLRIAAAKSKVLPKAVA